MKGSGQMTEKNKEVTKPKEQGKPEEPKSEEWYTEALEELDEFIESQGIYIRQ